ncbi:MAG: flagellar motor switch protein FliG [Marinibacterium sp.]
MQNEVGTQLPVAAGASPPQIAPGTRSSDVLPPPVPPTTLGSAADQPANPSHPGARIGSAAKAAIVVRLLLNEGADLPLEQLPEDLQAKLTRQMSEMRLVDRTTLADVVHEFALKVDGVGLHFPQGLHAALESLGDRISPNAADKLRRAAGMPTTGDPWPRLREQSVEDLARIMQDESIEVAAVLLSKLDTEKAASLLTLLPGPLARRITHAVSQTHNVTPAAVVRIGQSLIEQFDQQPQTAFDAGPDERLGAILNRAKASVRDEVLQALDDVDRPFGTAVRQHIFTFEHVPVRVEPLDVPKLIRAIDPVDLATAIAGAEPAGFGDVAEFLLANMSTRMADNLREEANELGNVRPEDAEAAMTRFVDAVTGLVEREEIKLIPQPEPEATKD